MTDEEKKAIEDLKEVVELYNDKCLITTEDDFKSIEILLNLIDKQSKEIEELKEERKKYPIAMNDKQYKKVIELAQKDIKEQLDRQINAKIEEYKELLYSYEKDLEEKLHYVDKGSMNCIIAQIQVLQSLLEKE